MRVLVLDNFDSFTYNLVDFFRQLDCEVTVYRNTAPVSALEQEQFDLLVLSPGPSVPRNAGNMMAAISRFYQTKPILGVCLGHQALIEFFGGTLANIAPVHGKSVPIDHDGRGIFTGIEPGAEVARYHSWAGDVIPPELEVTARSADGVVMAVRHKRFPIEGIQFHPESVLSMKNNAGMRMLRNVVEGRLSAGNRIYHDLSKKLQAGTPIDSESLRTFLTAIEEGQLSDDQKQILLVSLSHRLRNAAELKTFIEATLSTATHHSVEALIPDTTVDICGTGGSNLPRINTSTLASLLLAHCGLPVAKHGNRAAAGRFGSFNLLENLGVPFRYDKRQAAYLLEHHNLAFLFAPEVFPVFRHFAPVRVKIGVPTIFNVLRPLINPLQPRRQFIGTAFADLMEVIFETGIRLGREQVIVVRGWDGLDDISISAPTRVLEYRNGKRYDYEIKPEDFGIAPVPFEQVSAANTAATLDIARQMLDGQADLAHQQLVAANAAFIYTRFIDDIPLPDAFQKMMALIGQGVMRQTLDRYLTATQEAVSEPVTTVPPHRHTPA